MLTVDDALIVVRKLIDHTLAAGRAIDSTIILVGGTALSAHGIRNLSEDVDLYIKEFSDDVVFQLERELKKTYGEQFKLDVTATENLWGSILLRDITDHSPTYSLLEVNNQHYEIKALSIEDLFLLKLSAGRDKDRRDLPAIAAKTTSDALIQRFNSICKWHGNRHALIGYADDFVRQLEKCHALNPTHIVKLLELPTFIKDMLWETYYPTEDDEPDASHQPTP